jgi:hypothetical protein
LPGLEPIIGQSPRRQDPLALDLSLKPAPPTLQGQMSEIPLACMEAIEDLEERGWSSMMLAR